ncbi:aromatic acid exporter family protein [Tissierella sp.]|uniref:FUSC family protein n=1 Tax=Tissierella sp. TaxID=41274 RepID=UPI0028642788|nr:aromatic acid exporter family protein [Tissierella sp.]MDR7856882.1 aromatic acid exporter family protein [Tissierella sp.]
MKKSIKLKMGMRTIKTGLAVAISLILCIIFKSKSPIFAAIGAIASMQSSVSESLIAGKNRMLGTFIGAIVGLIFSLAFPENPIFIGLGVSIVIHICHLLDWNKALQLSAIVFVGIALNPEMDVKLSYSLFRIIDTFIGIIVGMIINYFVSAPNMEERIMDSIEILYIESKDIINNLIWKIEDVSLKEFRTDTVLLTESYEALSKDIHLNLTKKQDSTSYNRILSKIESIENNISLLSEINKSPFLTKRNQELLEELFNKPIPINEELVKEDIDIVYNYHLTQALDNLLEIKEFIG